MTEPAIRCEGLGKRYRIGARERYSSVRDRIAELTRSPVRTLARSLRAPDPSEFLWSLKDVSFEVAPGELGWVGRDRRVHIPYQDKMLFRRQLAWIAQERGHKPGWIARSYREKFGVWPKIAAVDPLPPDPLVRAWVRARAIAFAQSRRPLPPPEASACPS